MNELKQIAEEIRTQDNLATEHPIFILFDRSRYPAEDGTGDEYIYVDRDGDCREIKHTKEALVEYYRDDEWFPKDTDDLSEDQLFELIQKHRDIKEYHVHIINEFRQAFFTKRSAEEYLESNRHHFKDPLIYCESLWRNYEMQAIRDALIHDKFE
jgi:hypothetical protein